MAKITIELTKDNKTIVTYDNGSIIYPICEVTETDFNISKVTDVTILTLICTLLCKTGSSLRFQLSKQGFVNKPLNKLADGK